MTYAELDRAADRLAHRLRDSGFADGAPSAVASDRAAEVLVGVLAALKAGGAYVVIPVHESVGEIGRLLERADVAAVITREDLRPRVDDGLGRLVVCLEPADLHDADPDAHPDVEVAQNGATAAVVFTAGTTGERRAVIISQQRLAAAYAAWSEVYRLTPDDRHLVTAPFDSIGFTAGWIRALGSGGTLVVATDVPEVDLAELGITVLDTDPTTALALLLAGAPGSLRLAAVSGEQVRLGEHRRLAGLLAPGARLVSVYDPTEATGCGAWFETDQLVGPEPVPDQVALLGRAFPGGRVAVRDGEIRITPPAAVTSVPTGDAGRLRTDGLVEFRGRLAHRIDRGRHPIDPYPAEAALSTHPAVAEAVVTGTTDPDGSTRLVVHVVPRAGVAPSSGAVLAHLDTVLPPDEVPGSVALLPALPRNRAAKIDRRALPRPASPAIGGHRGAKSAAFAGTDRARLGRWLLVPLVAALLAGLVTDGLWPGSTDLTGVPGPWNALFVLLYVAEWLAFGIGIAFLFSGRGLMRRHGLGSGLVTAAQLAIVWLLVAWWPQDNLYRLAAKNDWPQQALLVYLFNVPLMIAAVMVAVHVTRRPRAVR